MIYDTGKSISEATRTLGLVIVVSMFVAFCTALMLFQ
jgi:hypothetical protein